MYRRVQRGFVAGHRINIGVQNTGPEIGTEKKKQRKKCGPVLVYSKL